MATYRAVYLTPELFDKLKTLKAHPRETMGDVVQRLIDEHTLLGERMDVMVKKGGD